MAGAGGAAYGRVVRLLCAGMLATGLVACSSGSGAAPTRSSSPGAGGAGSTSSSTQADAVALVAHSATKTTAAKNAKVDVRGVVATSGQTLDVTGTGTVDFADRTFQLVLNLPPAGQVEERLVDRIVYLKVPGRAAAQFGGKHWLRLDPQVLGAGTGNANPFESLGSSDPSQILSSLRGVATVSTVGPDTVRGTPTTHYRADVDVTKAAQAEGLNAVQKQQLQRALGGQNTVPEDVWIDPQGLVRRLAVDLGAAPAGSPTPGTDSSPRVRRSRVQAEFYDFGQAATTVTSPPTDDVVDFSRILEQFGSLGTGTGGTPS